MRAATGRLSAGQQRKLPAICLFCVAVLLFNGPLLAAQADAGQLRVAVFQTDASPRASNVAPQVEGVLMQALRELLKEPREK